MPENLTDQEFLKIVHEKLGGADSERYRLYRSLKRRRIVRVVLNMVFLGAIAAGGYYFFEKHDFDYGSMDEETRKIFMLSLVPLSVFILSIQNVMRYFVEGPKRKYHKICKHVILPQLAKILGNFDYRYKDRIDLWQLKKSKIIPRFKEVRCSDVFRGSYKNVGIEFAELHLYNEIERDKRRDIQITRFKGLYVLLDIGHINFNGHTILNNDKDAIFGIIKLGTGGLKKAGMVDPEFEKIFDVYTDDQVEARYLLDPVMIEKITRLYNQSHGTGLRAALYESKMLVLISTEEDHFEAEDLEIPIFDGESFLRIKHDIENITSIIDKLHLYDTNKAYVEEVEQARENIDQDENEKEKPVQSEEPGGEEISEHNYSF